MDLLIYKGKRPISIILITLHKCFLKVMGYLFGVDGKGHGEGVKMSFL